MSRKPEDTFRESVHKYFLPSQLHHEKIAKVQYAASGTADDWYSGKGPASKDLWIEWKFIAVPVRDSTIIDLVGGKDPTIRTLQQLWLKDRHAEGRNVWVGVGSAKGGVIFRDLQWETRFITAEWFRAQMLPRKELAEQIVSFVQGKG